MRSAFYVRARPDAARGEAPELHILAALAEFERERIRDRVMAGLQRAVWNVSKSTAARSIRQGKHPKIPVAPSA